MAITTFVLTAGGLYKFCLLLVHSPFLAALSAIAYEFPPGIIVQHLLILPCGMVEFGMGCVVVWCGLLWRVALHGAVVSAESRNMFVHLV